MYLASANKMYHLNRSAATKKRCYVERAINPYYNDYFPWTSFKRKRKTSRFFLSLRTNCSKASSIGDRNAKVIYSLAPAMGHNMDEKPVEFKSRVPVVLSVLEKAKLTPEFRGSEIVQLQNIRSATMEDITSVHPNSYLFHLDKAIRHAANGTQGILSISDFCYVTVTTFDDSSLAVGAGLSMVDSVVEASKISENPPIGFALIEPPIHHIQEERSKGYCVFDNVAIAARYAQRVHGLKRVFIIDFDVHFAYETNEALYDDPNIFVLSTHEDSKYNLYKPCHTGNFDDIGRGNAEGTTLNVPLPAGSGDIAMRTVFDEVIVPSVQRFKPDIILVSAGYDGHAVDPLGKFLLTTKSYYMLASGIKQLAKDMCGGRCVFILAGAYNQDILSFSVAESFRAFLEEPSLAPEFEKKYAIFMQDEPSCKVKQVIQKIKHLHSL